MWPEVAAVGTVVEIEVELAVVGKVGATLRRSRSFAGLLSKSVPVMATTVPGVAIVGVKLVIVGRPPAVTLKLEALLADPAGLATVIGPVVAPAGTLTTS